MPITVICVLRSGGDFTPKDVIALQKQVKRHITDCRFVCLSDMNVPGVNVMKLDHDWEGWWSKIEVFQSKTPTIYLDLDTVILNSLAPLVTAVLLPSYAKLYMLQPFNRAEVWASGVMAWTGDWSFIREGFNYRIDAPKYKMDQRYIRDVILLESKNIHSIQSELSGVYSYKNHCKNRAPTDARLICFHGKPRPSEVSDAWVMTARGELPDD